MRKKKIGKTGLLGLKINMDKAYDRVEWKFLQQILYSLGFLDHLVTFIMKCVTSVSFLILLNGSPCEVLKSKRGLKQGDSLSPYPFIRCAKVLSGLILKAQEVQTLHGIRMAKAAPEISHIFFADDNIVFSRANMQKAEKLKQILIKHQQASGQLLNLDKLEISFS